MSEQLALGSEAGTSDPILGRECPVCEALYAEHGLESLAQCMEEALSQPALTELPDHIGKFQRDARATSRAAALQVFPKTGTQRRQILAALMLHGPLTDEGLTAKTGIHPNSERPRRVELVEGGWVHAFDEQGSSEAGNDATRWDVTMRARTRLLG